MSLRVVKCVVEERPAGAVMVECRCLQACIGVCCAEFVSLHGYFGHLFSPPMCGDANDVLFATAQGCFVKNPDCRSIFTVMIYLNDNFEGEYESAMTTALDIIGAFHHTPPPP